MVWRSPPKIKTMIWAVVQAIVPSIGREAGGSTPVTMRFSTASIIKAHTPTLGEVWCGINGRVPNTPLNVLRWKSNLLTFKKRLSSLFLLNFECDIGLICHCGTKRDKFWIKGKFTFSPFCQLQCTFKTIFSFTTAKVPVCLFVSTRENVVMLWIKKKKSKMK